MARRIGHGARSRENARMKAQRAPPCPWLAADDRRTGPIARRVRRDGLRLQREQSPEAGSRSWALPGSPTRHRPGCLRTAWTR
ncbi:hypothetical protein SZ55_2234 [Pseudomonas sp. FeS53a]|nr:hypothetical protein SZ55_2234 [Pseudomonas sp. FeS53a]